MRLAYIAAGAAGMYCGTCLHDNTLAAALKRQGVDLALIPTYTPLRTDEEDVSLDQIFYGGINIFLQQKWPVFRHTPRAFDRLLDQPRLLGALARFGTSTNARDLGALTVSVLEGEEGNQQKELARLVTWLRNEFKPEIVQLTNAIFSGMGRQLKAQLDVPILCALQGEDLFLDSLIDPYKSRARKILCRRAGDIDAFIAPCESYRNHMSEYLEVPLEKIHVIPLGLNLSGHGESAPSAADDLQKIGYLARICPEKGFHLLTDAFRILKDQPEFDTLHFDAAGYLSARDQTYFDAELEKIQAWGLADSFTYYGEVDRVEKIRFLGNLDVFSVPTTYAESKGLPILESLANGTPVVQPNHGSFPEILEATGGGLLTEPHSSAALAEGIARLLRDEKLRLQLGETGKESVHSRFNDTATAQSTLAIYNQYADVSIS